MCQKVADEFIPCKSCFTGYYRDLVAAIGKVPTGFGSGPARKKARAAVRVTCAETGMMLNAQTIVSYYAAFASGVKAIEKDIETFKAAGDRDTADFFKARLAAGKGRFTESVEQAKKTAYDIKSATVGSRGHGDGSRDPLRKSKRISTQSLLDSSPRWFHIWSYSTNRDENTGQPLSPAEIAFASNSAIDAYCPDCGAFMSRDIGPSMAVRVLAPKVVAGKPLPCPACNPMRRSRMVETKGNFADLITALGGRPENFDTLTASTKLAVLNQFGLVRGNKDATMRSVCMSFVHGNYTLAEFIASPDCMDLIGKTVEEDSADEDTEVGSLADFDADHSADKRENVTAEACLEAVGIVEHIDSQTVIDMVYAEQIENLWALGLGHPDAETFVTTLLTSAASNASRTLIDRFAAELKAVTSMPLPSTFKHTRGITPTLAQRRFAYLMTRNDAFLNLSSTGAGKTIAAILAAATIGAHEVVVFGPNAVVEQWKNEATAAIPGVTVVTGLPTVRQNERMTKTTDGIRVRVVNYDKVSKDYKDVAKQTTSMVAHTDLFILDEIHKAKKSGKASQSKRNFALGRILDTARQRDDVKVVGMSATPVVNNLDEAESIIRLVFGSGAPKFSTAPTFTNASKFYQFFRTNSIRLVADHGVTVNRRRRLIDVSEHIGLIDQRVKSLAKAKSRKDAAALDMEIALLDHKMEALIDEVNNASGKVIIYTQFIEQMVDPIVEALTNAGISCTTFTGQADIDRNANLAAFIDGQFDVIIGSNPITTGVDGLQNVCAKTIVVSAPWTAADDDQLVGRTYRHGQKSAVEVVYLATEAKVAGSYWSWDVDNRLGRIDFKRSIADAATDGVMPEGLLDDNDAASRFAHGLSALVEKAAA
ncbi:helicase-related protein [Aeromicrobium sp. 179-A 4D2 NHS]|uniref:helicase-related protein n=1 Tax=Aeromicrobium sp. 179-A 4D2 NHS TaxID=3142375 RepID=UPI00399FBED9